jgi:hypothetical protein
MVTLVPMFEDRIGLVIRIVARVGLPEDTGPAVWAMLLDDAR